MRSTRDSTHPGPAQLNKLVVEGGHDLILSLGQVVPHEVLGMANYNKNLFIGVGGAESINFSHFIGATYGMERMMGRANNPLRQILNTATREFIDGKLPVAYMHTVVGRGDDGELLIRGLFIRSEYPLCSPPENYHIQRKSMTRHVRHDASGEEVHFASTAAPSRALP